MNVTVKKYSAPCFDCREAMRYAGCRGASETEEKLIYECKELVEKHLTYKVCFCELPISFFEDEIDLTFAKTNSKSLRKHLEGCDGIVLFCATVGLEMDRFISKYATLSPSKAVCLQGIGAERVEALCDVFENEIKGKYSFTKPRFSAGYGDLPLELQKNICTVLDTYKNIGVALNENLMLSPSKSVTAIIGVRK